MLEQENLLVNNNNIKYLDISFNSRGVGCVKNLIFINLRNSFQAHCRIFSFSVNWTNRAEISRAVFGEAQIWMILEEAKTAPDLDGALNMISQIMNSEFPTK